MLAVRDHINRFPSETKIAVIAFGEAAQITAYLARNPLPFPMLADPKRVTYHRYGLGSGPWWRIYGTSVLRRYFQLLSERRVGPLQTPTEDTAQLGGDFVVAPDGTLAYARWSKGPADRPPVQQLVDAARLISSNPD